jgi:predicted ATPase
MPRLLGIRIQNYKSLADITLGQIGYGQGAELPPLCCFVGPNGSGKSTLLDAFGFLADSLREGVEGACDKPHRGGFSRLRTAGTTGPIRFELYYRESPAARPITFSFAVDAPEGVPLVTEETLQQRRLGQKHGRPYPFLRLVHGKGSAWLGEASATEEGTAKVDIELEDVARLGITTLGQLKEHPRIVGLRSYIEGWYLSYFVPDAARRLPPAGAQRHLDRTGENVANVVEFLERNHRERFRTVLTEIASKIPGLQSIATERTSDGRLLLCFNEQGFVDPFYQQAMSDGTLKMFTYLLLLSDPEPRPFIGIEEPENGLYHKLLGDLARQFLAHSEDPARGTQLFVTTHSPYLVNLFQPTQVWLLDRQQDGSTRVTRTDEFPAVTALTEEGIPLGSVWFSDHFGELHGS